MRLRQSRNRGQDEQSAKQKRWSEIMADRLNGYRILILETREEAQFSRLLTEQGADVLQCPMFTIHDAPDPAPVEAWIVRAIEKPLDDMVLLTGEGLRRLMKVVRLIGVEEAFVASLGKARKFARGPKPGKALREIGLEPQMTTEKPTSEGIAEMLSRLDLSGHRLGLQLYPDKDHSVLIGAIKAQAPRSIPCCPMPMTRRPPTPTSCQRSTRWRPAASTRSR
jgi:uroporphyrinogen-III synthase